MKLLTSHQFLAAIQILPKRSYRSSNLVFAQIFFKKCVFGKKLGPFYCYSGEKQHLWWHFGDMDLSKYSDILLFMRRVTCSVDRVRFYSNFWRTSLKFLQAISASSSRGFLYYVLALEFWTFVRSLLDSQLLAKSQTLHYQITSAEKQATK